MQRYKVWIQTGEQTLAGTDSNVFIQLAGTQGQSESIHLPARDLFAFESGAIDEFVLEVPELGTLMTCCVGHDNSEGDSGWYVKTVRVQSEDGPVWNFTFERWLGVEESGELFACVSPS